MADDEKKPPEADAPAQSLRVVIDDAVADGIYSNMVTVISGPLDFFIDFGRMVPGRTEFKVLSRIIMTPAHAKQFAQALNENLRRYEKSGGVIPPVPQGPQTGSVH